MSASSCLRDSRFWPSRPEYQPHSCRVSQCKARERTAHLTTLARTAGHNRWPHQLADPLKFSEGRTLVPVWKVFLIAFSVLLPLINPLGSALVFLGLVGDAPPNVLRSLARRIAINNIVFLGVFELAGRNHPQLLRHLSAHRPTLRRHGRRGHGLGRAERAQRRRRFPQQRRRRPASSSEPDTSHLEEGIFYPFTFPITSGPGTLVGLLTVTAHISDKNLTHDILAHLAVFLAIVVLSVLCYFCYAYAPKITKKSRPPRPMESCAWSPSSCSASASRSRGMASPRCSPPSSSRNWHIAADSLSRPAWYVALRPSRRNSAGNLESS